MFQVCIHAKGKSILGAGRQGKLGCAAVFQRDGHVEYSLEGGGG